MLAGRRQPAEQAGETFALAFGERLVAGADGIGRGRVDRDVGDRVGGRFLAERSARQQADQAEEEGREDPPGAVEVHHCIAVRIA